MSMWNVGERRAAVSLVEFSDTACFLPCRHCSELVQEDDRFCRFCGADQLDVDGNGPVRPGDGPASTASAARSPTAVDAAGTVQPGAPAALALYAPTNAANEAAKPEPALDLPSTFAPRRLLEGSGPPPRAGRSVIALSMTMGLVSLGALLALVLGRPQDLDTLGATAEPPIRSAQVRNEPVSADLTMGGVVNAGERLDPQVPLRAPEAQPLPAGTPDQLRDAASEVAIALGLGASAASAAAVTPPLAPIATNPAPEVSASEPKQEGCDEALAALAMCPKP